MRPREKVFNPILGRLIGLIFKILIKRNLPEILLLVLCVEVHPKKSQHTVKVMENYTCLLFKGDFILKGCVFSSPYR